MPNSENRRRKNDRIMISSSYISMNDFDDELKNIQDIGDDVACSSQKEGSSKKIINLHKCAILP